VSLYLGQTCPYAVSQLTSSGFMAHCLVFMPCFDPALDTFESYVTLSCEFCDRAVVLGVTNRYLRSRP
jgi:hypothetical protein